MSISRYNLKVAMEGLAEELDIMGEGRRGAGQ